MPTGGPAYRVFVGRLSHRAHERDVERLFKRWGKINEIQLKNGYCFVEYYDKRDAEDAAVESSGREICGERIQCEMARGTPRGRDYERDRQRGVIRSRSPPARRRRTRSPVRRNRSPSLQGRVNRGFRATFKNVSSKAKLRDLYKFFKGFGKVLFADIDHKTRTGYVEFDSSTAMEDAVEAKTDHKLLGYVLEFLPYKPQDSPGRSPTPDKNGRSVSRSGSRSRSRSHSASNFVEMENTRRKPGSRSPSVHSRERSRSRSASSKSRSRSR